MATLYEVTLRGSNQGQPHINVFHVFDSNDSATLEEIADFFESDYMFPMGPVLTIDMTWSKIEVNSLSAGNPGTFSKAVNQTGTVLGDPMTTGVHIFVKLVSADQSEKSGGKLVGALGEASFVDGDPTTGTLDFIQTVYDNLLANINPDIGAVLAIYRPTFSLPGIPAFSLVQSALVRGDSVNNRRVKSFER